MRFKMTKNYPCRLLLIYLCNTYSREVRAPDWCARYKETMYITSARCALHSAIARATKPLHALHNHNARYTCARMHCKLESLLYIFDLADSAHTQPAVFKGIYKVGPRNFGPMWPQLGLMHLSAECLISLHLIPQRRRIFESRTLSLVAKTRVGHLQCHVRKQGQTGLETTAVHDTKSTYMEVEMKQEQGHDFVSNGSRNRRRYSVRQSC